MDSVVLASCQFLEFLLCRFLSLCFFFFTQKTAYEMRISVWSSDVCSSDLFKATGERYVLAARLSGPLKTAFPERKDDKQLREGKADGSIILVADSDLLADRMWVSVQSILGQRAFNPFAGNGDFVVNAVDNLVGRTDQIGRASCRERVWHYVWNTGVA